MLGRVLQGLATVDNNPDLLRLRPANRSKTSADSLSLHVIQPFKAHSGAGPLLGIAFTVLSLESSSDSLSDFVNMSLRVAGRSYHLLPESVELVSISFLPAENCGKVDFRTHEPKQFLAVYRKKNKSKAYREVNSHCDQKWSLWYTKKQRTKHQWWWWCSCCYTYIPSSVGPDFGTILGHSHVSVTRQSVFERRGCLSLTEISGAGCANGVHIRVPEERFKSKQG